MLTVYSLLSHTCEILPHQRELFDRFYGEDLRYVVVQGPFGSNDHTAGGNLKLGDGFNETITLPEAGIAGRFWGSRMRAILRWLVQHTTASDEGFALIVHGDLLPLKKLEPAELLQGAATAARGNPATRSIASTWLLLDLAHRDAISVGGLPFVSSAGHLWPAHDVTRENSERLLGFLPDDYDDGWHFEYCEPGFLHLDKQSVMPQMVASKLRSLETALGLSDRSAPCRRLTSGLPFHHAIPDPVASPAVSVSAFSAPEKQQAEGLRRMAICRACPDLGEEGGYEWCILIDDNHSEWRNCQQSKSARHKARLFREWCSCNTWKAPGND